jgi:hypothetical protein
MVAECCRGVLPWCERERPSSSSSLLPLRRLFWKSLGTSFKPVLFTVNLHVAVPHHC